MGPGSIWGFASIIIIPFAIGFMVIAPLNWRSNVFAVFGVAVFVKTLGIVDRRIFLTDGSIIVRCFFIPERRYRLDEVRSLRFATIWGGGSRSRPPVPVGLSVLVESPRHTLHFDAGVIDSTKASLTDSCQNAVIIDDDDWTLHPPRNQAAVSRERMQTYARRVVIRHIVSNGLWTLLFVGLSASICFQQLVARKFGVGTAGAITSIGCAIAAAIFLIREHRFATRLLRWK